MITIEAHLAKSLLTAVEEADVRQAARLTEQGADLNSSSGNGWTPLMLAILHGSAEMMEFLLKHGADPNRTTQSEENSCRSPLAVAISNGRLEAVRLLIAHGASADKPDANGLTAVGLAQKLAQRPLHRDQIAGILSLLKEHRDSSSRAAYLG